MPTERTSSKFQTFELFKEGAAASWQLKDQVTLEIPMA